MCKLGAIIKEKRKEKRLALKQLGNICNVSDSEIMKIENGERRTPNWTTLCKIAKALDFPVLSMLYISGYITDSDISFFAIYNNIHQLNAPDIKTIQPFNNINQLDACDIKTIQHFIDFIISQKHSEKGGI